MDYLEKMQQVIQGAVVPDILNSKFERNRKRTADSRDSSIDDIKDAGDQSVPKVRVKDLKVFRSNMLEDKVAKLIDSKFESINMQEIKGIKEEIGAYSKPHNISDKSHHDEEDFDKKFVDWRIGAQEMKKTLNWSPLDDIMEHSQAFQKAANNEKQSLKSKHKVIYILSLISRRIRHRNQISI
jgi:hypothetical protein